MIGDRTAQRIASEWHGGQGSALYLFASSGAIISHDIVTEINTNLHRQRGKGGPGFTELVDLRTYVRRYGPRSPVPGWYESTITAER